MRVTSAASLAVLITTVAGCGSSSSSSSAAPAPQGPGFFISITNMAFSPLALRVPPGATVTVLNGDAMSHSVTSAAVAGSFTPGAVGGVSFNTGAFTGTKTFVIPSSATSGTVVPYFCTVHLATMATPTGTITIDPSATPTTAPGGTSGSTAGSGGGY